MRVLWILGVACLGIACSAARPRLRQAQGTALQRAQDVLRWELLTRTDMVLMLTALIGPQDTGQSCPTVSKSEADPALTLYTGNCTDDAGQVWHGQAERWVWNTDGQITQRLRMRGYGSDDNTITGSSWLAGNGSNDTRFFVDIEMNNPELAGDPQWIALRHRGTHSGGQWRGHGRVAVDGWGRVATRTEGLTFDKSRCKSEPVAGKTRLSAARHEAEIEYDGATDCDRPGTAQWRYDGQPRGELSDVSGELGCSPSDNEDAPPAGAWLILLSVGALRLSPRLRRPRAARR